MNWIIRNKDSELLYWSNTDGWGDRESANRFTDTERDNLRLPLNGTWEDE